MAANSVPNVVLNSGEKMPAIGYGTGTPPPPEALIDAIKIGYRHFDTAAFYNTEELLGQAVSKALEEGLIKNRDELFITSKLWSTDAHHDLVLPALKTTLKNLGLEYVDLYLIHWPVRFKQDAVAVGLNFKGEDIIPIDIKGVWEAMEEVHRLGLAKSIGVSNFGAKKLSILLENAKITPAVNQVEMSPSWNQGKLREFCKQKGIHVGAWSPLGAYKDPWGSAAVMDNPILHKIAEAKNKSVPQIVLRWIYQHGATAIVKSFNKERMKQNIEIFDWELTQEESDKIHQISQKRTINIGEMFIFENGPYKSLEELLDGDV